MIALDPHGRVLPCAPAPEHDDARWLLATQRLAEDCDAARRAVVGRLSTVAAGFTDEDGRRRVGEIGEG